MTRLRRLLALVEPWYNWGKVAVERMETVDGLYSDEGDVRFFEVQWLGLHLGFQLGRTPAKGSR